MYTVLSSNTTEECFHSTTSTEGRDLYLTEIISDIGEFSHFIDCHGVCGNNNEFSFITNLLVINATNAGKFRLNMNFPSLSPKRKQTSCQGEAIVCFHSLFESWQTPYRYKTADDFF